MESNSKKDIKTICNERNVKSKDNRQKKYIINKKWEKFPNLLISSFLSKHALRFSRQPKFIFNNRFIHRRRFTLSTMSKLLQWKRNKILHSMYNIEFRIYT